MTADLAEYARSRGLPLVAARIADTQLPTEAAADAGLCAAIATEAPAALPQLIRRGLETRLVEPVMRWLGERPVEVGLLSWDVLSGSLLGPGEDAWMQRLRDQARAVRAVLPEAGAQYVRCNTQSAAELVAELTGSQWSTATEDELLVGVTRRDLGALEELRRRDALGPFRERLLPAFRAFACSLHLAHLPTLASFYLEYLFRALGDRESLQDLCEVLLDVGGIDALPEQVEILGDGALSNIELLGYTGIRAALTTGHSGEYLQQLDASPTKIDYTGHDPEQISRQMPRPQVAHAELMLKENGPPVPFDILRRIVAAAGPWRYGLRVLTTAAAATLPRDEQPVQLVDAFVAAYGNDFKLWYLVNLNAPADTTWIEPFHQRLVREVAHLPHDVNAWAALAVMLNPTATDDPLLGEVNRRAEWQCRL